MKKSMFYENSPIIFANAKKLRSGPASSGIIFWLLKQHFSNFRCKRQRRVSQYIADFYCHKLKLVIGIDGGIHQTKEVKNKDKLRDEFLQTLNLKIVRFTNNEVCKNGDSIVKKLRAAIDSLTK